MGTPKNTIIDEIVREYEGLTYKAPKTDPEEVEEDGFVEIDSESNKDFTETDDEQSIIWKKRFAVCSRCAMKHVCTGPCELLVDNSLDEDEINTDEQENEFEEER